MLVLVGSEPLRLAMLWMMAKMMLPPCSNLEELVIDLLNTGQSMEVF